MSDVIATEWRPTGDSLVLPADTTHIWARLQDLTELTWPTAAEQVERIALVSWMNPRYYGAIADTDVLGLTSKLANLSLESDAEFLIPLYLDAEKAWFNLVALFNGKPLSPARPEYDDESIADYCDSWRQSREVAGMDWWHSVMQTLDMLFMNSTVFYFNVADDVQSELRRELDHRTRSNILDAPLSIGAHMYFGPLGLGNETSNISRKVHKLSALALSVATATTVLAAIDPDDTENYKAAANRLGFLWDLLKGYTWASSRALNDIGFFLEEDPASWEQAKLALIEGRTALAAACEKLGSSNVMSGYSTMTDTGEIALTPIDDIIEGVAKVIDEATRGKFVLR